MQRTLLAVIAVLFCMVVLSFLGQIFPIGDSLAVGRLPLLVIILLLTFFINLKPFLRILVLGVCLAIFEMSVSVTSELAVIEVPKEPEALRIYQKNVLISEGSIEKVIEDGIALKTDVFALQEVDKEAKQSVTSLLSEDWDVISCMGSGDFGLMLIARIQIQFEDAECETGKGYLIGKITHNNEEFLVGSLHLHWPFPFEQPDQLPQILKILSDMEHPVIIGADLNMVPWGSVAKQISESMNGAFYVPSETTYNSPVNVISLPIDYVFTPKVQAVEIAKRPLYGSDHFGLIATIQF